jgi:hypothetical protein
MRRRWGFRGWAIVWAVLQFALPTAAAFADARLERESVTARGSHAESRSDASCHRVHPTECALCQVVSRASAPSVQGHSCPAIVSVIEQVVIAERPWRALAGSARLALARAPPLS